MTSTVNVIAHCAADKVVAITINTLSGASDPIESTLQDGEIHDLVIYGDMVVTISEVDVATRVSHVARLKYEIEELRVRLKKLVGFLSNETLANKLETKQLDLLKRQRAVMETLFSILQDRLTLME